MKLYEFEVVQYLDGGGQGDVYLVLHLPSNKNYVMKLIWNKSGQTEDQVLAAASREIVQTNCSPAAAATLSPTIPSAGKYSDILIPAL